MNDGAAGTAEQIKRKLADAGLVLATMSPGQMTDGHISARDPDDPARFFIKARGVGFDEMAPHNILTLGATTDIVNGTGQAPAEACIHAGIYGARPDVQAIIYSHPVQLMALAASARSIRPFNHAGATFLNALPIHSGGLSPIDTATQGQAVAASLGPHRALLLKHHGIVMTGRSIEEAVILLYTLDNAAEMQLRIEAAEAAEPDFPEAEIDTIRSNMLEERQFAVNFNYLVRQERRRLGI